VPGQPEGQEEIKRTWQRPPLPPQLLGKTALLLQPRAIPAAADVPERGILAVSFL